MGLLDWLRPSRGAQTWPAIYRGGLPEVLGTGDGALTLLERELVFQFTYRPQRFRLPLDGASVRAYHYPTGHQSEAFIPAPSHPSDPMVVVTCGGDRRREARFQTRAADEIVGALAKRQR